MGLTFTHLHTRSWFSFLQGGSSPEALAARAAELGQKALALTDVDGVYGVVRFQRACRTHGLRPIIGAQIGVAGHPLILIAENNAGYANLCRLLTAAHLASPEAPSIALADLGAHTEHLFCLTGTDGSRLWQLVDEGDERQAGEWLFDLHTLFQDRLSLEIRHHRTEGERRRLRRLKRLSDRTHIPLLATGDVRYAVPEDYRRYDLMSCIRLHCSVFDQHPERPRNAEAYLKSAAQLRKLLPFDEAFARAAEIGAAAHIDLLPDQVTPPSAAVPPPFTAQAYLRKLCRRSFLRRYKNRPTARAAATQLKTELDVIGDLDLGEFFLVVKEIVEEARRRGIRCAGRGSAANSVVAYVLGITGVDPIAHNLLFERFLHRGRKGTPDIDVDFDSERREEIIAWMEDRFGYDQTAMAATLVTYRARGALHDTAKALGWPDATATRLSKAVSSHAGTSLITYKSALQQIVGPSPMLDTLLEMAVSLLGIPRHPGQHSGGMVLSRRPLYEFTPVQRSANGVKVVQFDKDDIERLGLIKFDVLGLRMLASLSEANEHILNHIDPDLDLDELPLDDTRTFNMIRASDTIGVFQIESMGQRHLLGKHQPDTFNDLITEIALFRPGPIKGNMVDAFVRRRQGREPVVHLHPNLAKILDETYGVIIFQEQVLMVVHEFAGLSLEDADAFRRLMSSFRDPGTMENMRARFVGGAVSCGIPLATANEVFDKVSAFVGYGFCKSHAAAFAKTVYLSAYLKCHYPAAYYAAIMQHRPGMYSLMTLEQDARRHNVDILLPDVNRSGIRYEIERSGRRWAIRKPLTSIHQVSTETARQIVFERGRGPFMSVETFYTRIVADREAFDNIARSGALDALAGDSRKAFWQIGALHNQGPPGRMRTDVLFTQQAHLDIPDLPALKAPERISWDLETHAAGRRHPVSLIRRRLNDLEVRPIATCWPFIRALPRAGSPLITIAGNVIMRQRPPTAHGVLFLTIEDESADIQCIVFPDRMERLDHILKRSALIVLGEVQYHGNWRGLVLHDAWVLDGIMGGYEGHLSYSDGQDRHVTRSLRAPSP